MVKPEFNQLGGILDVGKQDSHLFTFAFQGAARGEDLLGQMLRSIRQGRPFLVGSWEGGRWRFRRWDASPNQDFALLIDGELLGLDEFLLQGLQVLVAQLELDLEGSVGDTPPALQERAYLIQHRIEIHHLIPRTATWPKRSAVLLPEMRVM